jgi:hypothetical protein
MDYDTFFTELYVMIDDWYKAEVAGQITKHAGAVAQMSDSEVLTVMIAGQWRSERGLLRWLEAHGRGWFPRLLKRSACNRRGRWLWGAFIALQQWVAQGLGSAEAVYECVDGTPVPAYSAGQALRETGHWLWESQRGHGGTHGGWFIGDRLLASVTEYGVVTGWVLGIANINERWLLEALLSARAGQAALVGPPPDTKHSRGDLTAPVERIGPLQAVGKAAGNPYLADRGFNGQRWLSHWRSAYNAVVLSVPPNNVAQPWPPHVQHQRASWRQVIETVFGVLTEVFGLKRVDAHSYRGLYTRIAAKCAAFNIGILFNRRLGRPDLAHATLLV